MLRKKQINVLASWLKDISSALHVPLELDSHGVCTFKLEDHVIAIEASNEYPVVNIYSPLLALPTDEPSLSIALQARALELNAFQIFTRGGAIAMAPGGGFLIYCLSVPTENVDAEKFSQMLGEFYETLPELKKMLLLSDKEPIKKTGPLFHGLKI